MPRVSSKGRIGREDGAPGGGEARTRTGVAAGERVGGGAGSGAGAGAGGRREPGAGTGPGAPSVREARSGRGARHRSRRGKFRWRASDLLRLRITIGWKLAIGFAAVLAML